MKAVRIHSFGGPEILRLEDVPDPTPTNTGVLIQVHAAGVNPVDSKIRSGGYTRAEVRLPLTLGRDVSGVVKAVGAAVTDFKEGDEVYAMLTGPAGGYAEYAVAGVQHVAPKPKKLDHVHAAAVPVAAITAWQGLFEHGNLQEGQRVLIHGAGGGVGHFAVQFAKLRGAFVVATASGRDLDLVRRLGADLVVDYRNERFEERSGAVDLVFDLVGGETQERSWAVLKRGGALVSTLKPPSELKAAERNVRAKVFMAEPKARHLAVIGRLIDEDKVQVVVESTLPLAEARLAHDHLEHDHVRGKVVLTVV